MVWAWMLWSSYALGTRTGLWFGHGCSGQRMLWAHERDYGFSMDALVIVCSGNTNGIMVWAWMLWSSYMFSEHERDYCLGMDALVSVCSRNTNEIMVWAWMLWSAYALGTRTALWASARGARALGAGGAKLLVSPYHTPLYNPPIISL